MIYTAAERRWLDRRHEALVELYQETNRRLAELRREFAALQRHLGVQTVHQPAEIMMTKHVTIPVEYK